MNQDIESFLQKAATDAELGAKVNATTDIEGLIALAKDEGFSVDNELTENNSELSDQDLGKVSGGNMSPDDYAKWQTALQKYNQSVELGSRSLKVFNDLQATIIRNIA